MIIIDGPNEKMRDALKAAIMVLVGSECVYHLSGAPRPADVKWLAQLVQTDNRCHLRDRLPMDLPPDHAARHMITTALAATGTVVVVCADDPAITPDKALAYLPYRGMLNLLVVLPGQDLRYIAKVVVETWRSAVAATEPLFDYHGAGMYHEPDLMVVGDRPNPYVPADAGRRVAFVSGQGCSLFLHAGLAAAGLGGVYLTNAHKFEKNRANLAALEVEVTRVNPGRILAMGSVAARALADIGAKFDHTFHPQYWKRFKNKDFGDLVETLRPASITT